MGALVSEIIQGQTALAMVSRTYDLAAPEHDSLVDDTKKGMESALQSDPLDVRRQCGHF